MVRRSSHGVCAVCLGLCAGIGLLAGCASNRGLTQGIRLSAVDVRSKPAERLSAERRQQSHGDDEADAEQTQSDDESVVVTEEVNAPESLAPRESRKTPRISARSRPAVDGPVDDLDVLLTGYRADGYGLDGERFGPDNTDDAKPAIRFQVPDELPGADAPALRVPAFDPAQSMHERKQQIDALYSPLPPLPDGDASQDDETAAWSLPELESIAWENHPGLMQAAAQVEAARGLMIQAGLHPNPLMGWEQDTIGPGIQGYKGPYVNQRVVTGGKLKLARCAAAMDYENAKVAYQRMKIDIATDVRDSYYDLLVSRQRLKMLTALTRFTDDIYKAQIELVAGGQAAPYEPLQLRVFAVQARNSVIEADNTVIAAGRRLGAATGMLDLERFSVAGQADAAPVKIDFQSAKAFLLENHTELVSYRNRIVQSQFQSRLEYIRPRIPDIDLYGTYQQTSQVGPFTNSYNFQVGAPIPIFDRNQGNILATQSALLANERGHAAVRNNLTGQLAIVLARYDTARMQAENYRRNILPDQVRTYRGVYSRYREAGPGANDNVNFGDVIVAQQTLGTAITGYAEILSTMWQAYVDAAGLLQMEDLRTLDAWFGLPN